MKSELTGTLNETRLSGFITSALTMATLTLAIGWFLYLFFIAQTCWSLVTACTNSRVVLTSGAVAIFLAVDLAFCLLVNWRQRRWTWFGLAAVQAGIGLAMKL